MKDEILIRFIRDEASSTEEQQVLDWLHEDPDHVSYFIKLKNIFVFLHTPDDEISLETSAHITDITQGKTIPSTFPIIVKKSLPYLAAACFALLFFLNLWGFFDARPNVIPEEWSPNTDQLHTLYTEKGVKAKTMLPDGSRVILNSDTKIIYANPFNGSTREVFLSGEAYFDVIPDSLRPLIVTTNNGFSVEVTGTTFNIRSYDNDTDAQVTLYSGKITLKKRDSFQNLENIVEMFPSQSIVLGKTIKPKIVKTTNIESESAWKDGYLVFESLTLREVFKRLERWHGIKIHTENSKILEMTVSANFQSESIVQIMELLKFSLNVDYEVLENEVILK